MQSAEAFWLCCGESEESFKAGRRVEARVRTVGEMDARVVLPDVNGIEAVIRRENVRWAAAGAACVPAALLVWFT